MNKKQSSWQQRINYYPFRWVHEFRILICFYYPVCMCSVPEYLPSFSHVWKHLGNGANLTLDGFLLATRFIYFSKISVIPEFTISGHSAQGFLISGLQMVVFQSAATTASLLHGFWNPNGILGSHKLGKLLYPLDHLQRPSSCCVISTFFWALSTYLHDAPCTLRVALFTTVFVSYPSPRHILISSSFFICSMPSQSIIFLRHS